MRAEILEIFADLGGATGSTSDAIASGLSVRTSFGSAGFRRTSARAESPGEWLRRMERRELRAKRARTYLGPTALECSARLVSEDLGRLRSALAFLRRTG